MRLYVYGGSIFGVGLVVNRLRKRFCGSLRCRRELFPLPLSHVCSGGCLVGASLGGRVRAEMADLSIRTCVVLSEGYNQVVVHGSCGLVDAIPHVRSSFPSSFTVSFAKAAAFVLDCLFGLCVYARSVDTELGPFSLVSSLWFSKGALGESVLGMVMQAVSPCGFVCLPGTAISVWDYVVASLTSLQVLRLRSGVVVNPTHLCKFGGERCGACFRFRRRSGVAWRCVEPDLFVVSIRNSPLLFVECFTDGVGYKLCGVHWKTATLETTLEIPASKETWRTSLSCDPRRRLRTASNS
ncbi:hypothetical protein Bca101_062720 [Brassica carinata]